MEESEEWRGGIETAIESTLGAGTGQPWARGWNLWSGGARPGCGAERMSRGCWAEEAYEYPIRAAGTGVALYEDGPGGRT